MAIAFGQQAGATQVNSVGTQDQSLTGTTAGSLLVWVSTNRDPGDFVASLSGGGWSILTNADASTGANLAYKIAAGGDVTVTGTFNRTLEGPSIANLIEFTATGSVVFDDSATNDNAAGTSHSHGACDISAAGLLIGTCSLSGGDSSGYSAATNYTKLDVGGGLRIMDQYRIATGTLTGETATWSSGADSIATAAIIASFVESGAASTAHIQAYLQMLRSNQ